MPMFRMSSLLHIFGPLLIGGFIYIGWRSSSLHMFVWLDQLGCTSAVTLLREQVHPFERLMPEWLLYSVPDGAWVWSMTSCFTLIWKQCNSKESTFWILSPILLGIGSELGQWAGLVPGTFDFTDLGVMLFAFIVPYLSLREVTSYRLLKGL
jgi:hypothetical protein